jgi:hypothetical protein
MGSAPGGFWPSNVTRRLISVTGADQIAAGVVGLIDRSWRRGMNGTNGGVVTGNPADPAYRWNGYVDYQLLGRASPVGLSMNLRGSPNIALPGTNGPTIVSAPAGSVDGTSSSVKSQLAQMVPGLR